MVKKCPRCQSSMSKWDGLDKSHWWKCKCDYVEHRSKGVWLDMILPFILFMIMAMVYVYLSRSI